VFSDIDLWGLLWGLLVAAVVFAFGAIFKPAVLVFRDELVWLYIRTCLVTKKLEDEIEEFAVERAMSEVRANLKNIMRVDPATGNRYVNDEKNEHQVVLTAEQFTKLDDQNDEMRRLQRKRELNIAKKTHRYDLLVKHYGHDKPNPIEEWMDYFSGLKPGPNGNGWGYFQSVRMISNKIIPHEYYVLNLETREKYPQ